MKLRIFFIKSIIDNGTMIDINSLDSSGGAEYHDAHEMEEPLSNEAPKKTPNKTDRIFISILHPPYNYTLPIAG
ncbi:MULTISPECIES: hypothetical protein [Klebsiella]|jgi:hypothetical protein|uniref:hypothetical protein n=1 Tax=Klebsiella TaxID=570 RepID=UPI00103305C5|nr:MULTISPECIES: hypothetical protein [Klebsiella]MEB5742651.1 hypothetical protein [Klebsiella aerogenes]